MQRRKFSREFKLEAVRLVRERGVSLMQAAKQESRNVSELFREAFRTYRFERIQRRLSTARKAAALRAPKGHGAGDIERLVDEIRSELSRSGQA